MKLLSNWYDYFVKNLEEIDDIAYKLKENAIKNMAIESWSGLVVTPLSLNKLDVLALEKDLKDLLDIWLDSGNRIFSGNVNKFYDYLGYNSTIVCNLLKYPQKVLSNVYCRWDIVFTEDGPKILELNVGSNTGGGNIDEIGSLYTDIVKNNLFYINRECKQEEHFHITSSWAICIKNITDTLSKNLSLLIVEDDIVFDSYRSTLNKLSEAFSKVSSRKCIVAKTSEISFKDGKMFVENFQIGAIYSFFTIEDVINNITKYKQIMDSIYKGEVKHIMGFEYIPYGNKNIMALLSDKDNSSRFTKEELELINKYIPESKKLTTENAEYAYLNKMLLYCKPADSYGGIGIICGWEYSDEEWMQIIDNILHENKTYILQKKVVAKNENLVYISSDNKTFYGKFPPVIGIYMINSKIIGGFVRTKKYDNNIININTGAAVGTLLIHN